MVDLHVTSKHNQRNLYHRPSLYHVQYNWNCVPSYTPMSKVMVLRPNV